MEIRVDKPEQKAELRKSYMKFLSNVKNPKKNAKNPFAKNTYADLSSVLESIKEAQKDTGLMFFQDIGADDGNMITCQSYFISEHGEIIFSAFRMPTGKADSQAVGSAETYARRYDAEAACGITGEVDDDGNASTSNYNNQSHQQNSNYRSSRSNNYHQSNNQVTSKQNDLMRRLSTEISKSTKESIRNIGYQAMNTVQVKDYNNMTRREASQVIDLLSNQLNKETEKKEGSK